MKRKVISFILTLALALSISILPCYAASDENNGHNNDSPNIPKEIIDHEYMVNATDSRIDFARDQVIKSEKNSNGNKIDVHKKDVVVLLPDNATDSKLIQGMLQSEETLKTSNTSSLNNMISLLSTGGGSKYNYIWDTSYTVKVYATIYYTTTTVGLYPFSQMSSITGGYSASGLNGSTIVGNSYQYMQDGDTTDGGFIAGNIASVTLSNSTTSWTQTVPSSWAAVYPGSDVGGCVGVNYTVTLHRSSSGLTWNAEVSLSV